MGEEMTDKKDESKGLQLDRRDFLKSVGLIGGTMAIAPAFLAACASGSSSGDKNAIRISNWTSYISDQLKKDFEKETGIKLTYIEDINDNSEYFAKIQPVLNRNNSINRDGFILTDWMANRIINQVKWAQPLDDKKFPNKKNLIKTLQSPSFDKTRKYSAPWASVPAGIAYNIKQTGKELKTFDDFLAVDGSKTVLSEMRDTIGIIGLAQGVDIETAGMKEFDPIFDKLAGYISSGKIAGINGNEYITDLSAGNLTACFAWAGDISQLAIDNPDIRFYVPESGGTLASDNFMIPISSDKPAAATEFINYFYDPVVSAKWVEAVGFISPVVGVKEELKKMGGEAAKLADNPLVTPTQEFLDSMKIFASLSEKDEEAFDKRSAEITGAG